jgi:hypothetical protein
MRKKKRKWDRIHEDDPGAGLLNLFDVWIAFAAALVLAIVSYAQLAKPSAITGQTTSQPSSLEAIRERQQALEHFRVSPQNAGGDGQRLGVAYRLKSGEVIYVPEGAQSVGK